MYMVCQAPYDIWWLFLLLSELADPKYITLAHMILSVSTVAIL